MRTYLFAAMLAVLPAAIAGAQFADPQNQPGAGAPAVNQANPGQHGAADAAAPPSNAMFSLIDADGDGVINKVELRKAIKALKSLDTDNDGNITLAEVAAADGQARPGGNAEVDRMMKELDKNGDGKLTEDEVPPHMLPMLAGADRNQDRAIDRDELAAAMQQNQFRPGAGQFPRGPNGRGADPRTGQFFKHDVNNDGRLTFDEIPRSMRGAFRPQDDLDRDGAIDAAELQVVIARMGGGARAIGAGAGAGGNPNTFRDPNRRNRPPAGGQN
ncbi:MAG: EF-hand domain-containing protein [Pirellulales bacterium]